MHPPCVRHHVPGYTTAAPASMKGTPATVVHWRTAELTVSGRPLAKLGMPEHKDMPDTIMARRCTIPSQIQYKIGQS